MLIFDLSNFIEDMQTLFLFEQRITELLEIVNQNQKLFIVFREMARRISLSKL